MAHRGRACALPVVWSVITLLNLCLMFARPALAAGDLEPPPPRPPGEVVVVDGGLVAMPPPLGRWYEQRNRYAGQLEAEVRGLNARLALVGERVGVWELRVQACEEHVGTLQQQVGVANRERKWRGLRDAGLVGLGAGAVLAGAWAVSRVR